MKQNTSRFSGTLAVLGFALALAGCSNGLKQDPYADQPDSVKTAGPMDPKPKPKSADADSPNYLRIQTDDNLQFTEGVETKTTIKGAILADVNGHAPVLGQDYELAIDNIADFPGATFDAVSGEFKWTPQPGFVDRAYTRNVQVEVTLKTKFGKQRQTQLAIIGVVTRAELDPTIVSIEDLTSVPTREGDKRDFKVVVRDPHADSKSANTKPRLTISSDGSSGTSGANLIYCKGYKGCSDPAVDPNDPMQYIFTLTLDLTNKEITTGQTTLNFGVSASSRFGETSAIQTASMKIITSINDPEMSWSAVDPINVVAGQENLVNFTVYDPKAEGTLTVNFETRCDLVLGADAVCSCKSVSRSGAQLCTISWKVPAQPLQTDFSISISSFNQSKYDSTVKKTVFPPRILHVIQPASGGTPPGPIHTNNAKPLANSALAPANNGGGHT